MSETLNNSASPSATNHLFVNQFTNGILDPEKPMLGPVSDGGTIEANTAPGCWGPMLTPQLCGGHEVTIPVEVEGAEIGDAIAIHIQEIEVTSIATASGTDKALDGRFNGDPFVAGKCPSCGKLNPPTQINGLGKSAIQCSECGADAAPFSINNGYTIAFNSERKIGVTVPEEAANNIGSDAKHYAAMPENSIQNSVLALAPHDLVGLQARLRPFMGQLGTTPAIAMPDSHNAGDFGQFLIGAPHDYSLTEEQLELRTDGHMDIDAVRVGAILICPVKVPGGGIYMGDMHALQGDGEIAGHTCDVAGIVKLKVQVIKNLTLDGPILFPVEEDLPFLAKPFTSEEREQAQLLAKEYGVDELEKTAPVSVVGTGANLNSATENGLQRAAELFGMDVSEIQNRATINGAIEIGRHPGVVQITFLVPVNKLEKIKLLKFAQKKYKLAD